MLGLETVKLLLLIFDQIVLLGDRFSKRFVLILEFRSCYDPSYQRSQVADCQYNWVLAKTDFIHQIMIIMLTLAARW